MKKSNNRPVEAMPITAMLDVAAIMIKTTKMKVITWINYEENRITMIIFTYTTLYFLLTRINILPINMHNVLLSYHIIYLLLTIILSVFRN